MCFSEPLVYFLIPLTDDDNMALERQRTLGSQRNGHSAVEHTKTRHQ